METSQFKNYRLHDGLITSVLLVGSFLIYLRTLAPDLLYGDSGEFQTLAYTLGYTHSTGYPIYLFLARLIGFIPLGNLAWRINLFSAISASVVISFIYLITRHLSKRIWGPIFGSIALMVSYTFWSQSIIAEVYTPALALIVISMWLLIRWYEKPLERKWELFLAALFVSSGVGVHASVGLLAPAYLLLVVWVWGQDEGKMKNFINLSIPSVGGTLIGILILIGGFLILDMNNPPSSFINVMLKPSRSIWSLTIDDTDEPRERILYTITGLQWQDAMFPGGTNLIAEGINYQSRFVTQEFNWVISILSWTGLVGFILRERRLGIFMLINSAFMLFYILNYQPPDKYIFFLPLYCFSCITAGIGIDYFQNWLASNIKGSTEYLNRIAWAVSILLLIWILAPILPSRIEALKTGTATFVKEEYVFPAQALKEPRAIATLYISALPQDAILVMDWRALYATLFIAHVEERNPGLRIFEATPHGSDGNMSASLKNDLVVSLGNGIPVFTNNIYGDIKKSFRVKKIDGSGLYQVFLK